MASRLTPASVLALPNELLLAIFRHIHDSVVSTLTEKANNLFLVDPVLPIICLSSVCRRWRYITLDEGYLWRHIRIRSAWTNTEKVAACLIRSEGHPLHLTWLSDEFPEPFQYELPPVWREILQHAHRWASFTLITSCANTLPAIYGDLQPVSLHQLAELTVFVLQPKMEQELGHYPKLILDAPALRHLSLSNYPLTHVVFPLGGLKILEFFGRDLNAFWSLGNFLVALRPLASLEHLTLPPRVSFHGDSDLPIIILPNLRTLTLRSFGYCQLCTPSNYSPILAPALDELVLMGDPTYYGITPLLSAWFNTISKLSIVHIESWEILDMMLKDGALKKNETWPNLRDLVVVPEVDASQAVEYASSRKTSGHPLRALYTHESALVEIEAPLKSMDVAVEGCNVPSKMKYEWHASTM